MSIRDDDERVDGVEGASSEAECDGLRWSTAEMLSILLIVN